QSRFAGSKSAPADAAAAGKSTRAAARARRGMQPVITHAAVIDPRASALLDSEFPMDLELPDELLELRRMVQDFVRREVNPRDAAIEESGILPQDLLSKMAELGLLGLSIPEEYGGMGLGTLGYVIVCEQFGRCHGSLRSLMAVENGIGVRALITDGSEEQKRRYLPELAAGRKLICFCLSEPGAGSDAAALSTTAR